jgi:arabinosyltransferase C
LGIAAWGLVFFEVLSLTLGMTEQYPAWSVGRSNLQALTGRTCGLANDVLVEQDPNAGMLSPINAPVKDALDAGYEEGFDPNGIPADVSADPVMERPGDRSFVNDDGMSTGSEAGTEGGTTPAPGINGSRARLPYNLDPAHTPVLGSWRSGPQVPLQLRSAWYRLPPREKAGPLLVVSAAGRFNPGEWKSSGRPISRPQPTSPAAQWDSPMSGRRPRGVICARRWTPCRGTPPRYG